jgi:murein DD-endopeptidase MepM/ murein hydrolase activator NlpD
MTGAQGNVPRKTPHDGVDIGGDVGDPVIAPYDGVVKYILYSPNYGYTVIIRHRVGNGPQGLRWTSYGHLRRVDVVEHLPVVRGRKLGEIGLFWGSGGVPHVHWQLCEDRDCRLPIDPMPFVDGCISKPRPSARFTYPVQC